MEGFYKRSAREYESSCWVVPHLCRRFFFWSFFFVQGGRTESIYIASRGCWVGWIPKRFLHATRWAENLSSGENRAVWNKTSGGEEKKKAVSVKWARVCRRWKLASNVDLPGCAEVEALPSGAAFFSVYRRLPVFGSMEYMRCIL